MKIGVKLYNALSLLTLAIMASVGILQTQIAETNVEANRQKDQLMDLQNIASELKVKSEAIPEAIDLFSSVSEIQADLSSVKFNYMYGALSLLEVKLEEAEHYRFELEPKLNRLIESVSTNPESDAKKVKDALEYIKLYGEKMFDAYINNSPSQGSSMAKGLDTQTTIITSVIMELSEKVKTELNTSVTEMITATDNSLDSVEIAYKGGQKISDSTSMLLKALLGAGGLSLVSVIVIGFIFSRTLNKATSEVTSKVSEIENKKDLKMRINRTVNDELGVIAKGFDSMLSSFQAIVGNVSDISHSVGDDAGDLKNMVTELKELLNDQELAIGSVATAITEMAASAEEVTQNATAAADASADAVELTVKGTEQANKGNQAINELKDKLLLSKGSIEELSADVGNISSILEFIQGIADQINLLALNAAIEAARAGEQGRGFAVVADEVRTLAGKTRESVDQISTTIDQLQSNSEKVVQQTMESFESAEKSQQSTEQMTVAYSEISGSMNKIMEMVDTIAVAAAEQSATSSEIAEQGEMASAKARDIADMSKQYLSVSDNMNSKSSELLSKVSEFSV